MTATTKNNSNLSYDHGDEQFKPNTTVAAVVHCQGKFLLVEEIENGQPVFNQPAGHLEANESLIAAIIRELEEETGLIQSPEYLSGIYYFHRPELNLYFLRFCFVIELEQFLDTQPQDDEIIACHWLTLEQIEARQAQLRSPMVLQCITDYLSGEKIPLSAIKSNL
ncbi:NUDIX hydrolase [Colwellia sp. MEBiC06753]